MAGHEDVEVGADAGPRLEQPVSDAGNLALKILNHLEHGVADRFEVPRGAGKQRGERPRQMDDRRRLIAAIHGQPTTIASTDQTGGRLSATRNQLLPSSSLP